MQFTDYRLSEMICLNKSSMGVTISWLASVVLIAVGHFSHRTKYWLPDFGLLARPAQFRLVITTRNAAAPG